MSAHSKATCVVAFALPSVELELREQVEPHSPQQSERSCHQSFKELFAPVSKHAMPGDGSGVVAGGDDQFAATEVCESDLDGALGKAGRVGKHS